MTSQQNYTFHDDGERTVIAVVRLSASRYTAQILEGEHVGLGFIGYGPSTYSAIADLNVKIGDYHD